jgi:hypothetical protein
MGWEATPFSGAWAEPGDLYLALPPSNIHPDILVSRGEP